MVLPIGHQHHVLSETVQHHSGQSGGTPQAHLPLPAGEHSEVTAGIALWVPILGHMPGHAGDGDVCHLVHSVVAHLAVFLIPGGQVVVFIVPDQPAGGDVVPPSFPAVDLFLFRIVLKIAEGHRPTGGNGGVELIYIIKNALIHGFHPPVYIHLPLELLGLIDGRQSLQLADEAVALPQGKKPAGLHRIHQQLQLRQLKLPLADEPASVFPLPALDVHPQLPQFLHVVVNALTLGGDIPPGQFVLHLLNRYWMVIIRPSQQEAVQD